MSDVRVYFGQGRAWRRRSQSAANSLSNLLFIHILIIAYVTNHAGT